MIQGLRKLLQYNIVWQNPGFLFRSFLSSVCTREIYAKCNLGYGSILIFSAGCPLMLLLSFPVGWPSVIIFKCNIVRFLIQIVLRRTNDNTCVLCVLWHYIIVCRPIRSIVTALLQRKFELLLLWPSA